jgi:hypothetical protein
MSIGAIGLWTYSSANHPFTDVWYWVDIPREGESTPSDQVLELIKDIKDSIESSNSEPDKWIRSPTDNPINRWKGTITHRCQVVRVVRRG